MSFLSLDFTSFLWGIALGTVGAFGAGFLKKAGEECYSWVQNKVNPKAPEEHPAQVVIHVAGNGSTSISDETVPVVLTPVSIERVSRITFEEIRNAIDMAPPLQRDQIANSYVGIRVEWDTYFKSGTRKDNDLVGIRLTTDPEHRLNTIWCEVLFHDYRELAVLPGGSKIRVSGEIAEAGSWAITLKDAHLYIYGNGPST